MWPLSGLRKPGSEDPQLSTLKSRGSSYSSFKPMQDLSGPLQCMAPYSVDAPHMHILNYCSLLVVWTSMALKYCGSLTKESRLRTLSELFNPAAPTQDTNSEPPSWPPPAPQAPPRPPPQCEVGTVEALSSCFEAGSSRELSRTESSRVQKYLLYARLSMAYQLMCISRSRDVPASPAAPAQVA